MSGSPFYWKADGTTDYKLMHETYGCALCKHANMKSLYLAGCCNGSSRLRGEQCNAFEPRYASLLDALLGGDTLYGDTWKKRYNKK